MTQSELFSQLWAIDQELERLPALNSALRVIGLDLCEPVEPGGYYCSPINSRCFAQTGGDGTHFSFIQIPGLEIKESPVVMTRPGFDVPNIVVGETLFEFLCSGYYSGFGCFEHLDAIHSKERLYDFKMNDCLPGTDMEWYKSQAAFEQKTLDYLVERLGLKPWENVSQRLAELEERYHHLLDVVDGE